MLDSKNIAKVCDWGLTGAGRGCGTRNYKAPELFNQAVKNNDIEYGKVDAWAAGLILYQLMERKFPFSDGQISELLAQELHTF